MCSRPAQRPLGRWPGHAAAIGASTSRPGISGRRAGTATPSRTVAAGCSAPSCGPGIRPRDSARGSGTGIRHAARPGCLRHGPADPAGRLPDRRPAAPLAGRPAGGRAPAPTRRPVGAFGQRALAQGARCRRPGLRCRSIWRLFCRHRHPAAGPPGPARRAGTPPTWPGTASPRRRGRAARHTDRPGRADHDASWFRAPGPRGRRMPVGAGAPGGARMAA